ncbi:MAG: magnesium/cobalt transporter CorA [bacterium]
MSKFYQRRDKKLCKPPGSLIYIGNQIDENVEVTIIAYNDEGYSQFKVSDLRKLNELLSDDYNVYWININGINNEKVINQVGELFNINSLVLEDIMNSDKRSKVDFYPEYTYSILKKINYDNNSILLKQISILKSGNYVLTFQETGADIFSNIVERISNNEGQIRGRTANFLFYTIIDFIVDGYFYCIEDVAEEIEELDNQVLISHTGIELRDLREYKKNIGILRKLLWPGRELVKDIIQQSSFSDEGDEELNYYYHDIYEHIIELMELLELLQGTVDEVQNLYHTKISHRMNRIMGLLTVISVIFLPLSLLVGIYGMNFKYMPELNIKWGYPAILVIMLSIALALIIYFKNKEWL